MGKADLVLEGGGVRGIASIGAITAFAEAGYQFERVAGASSGAIAAMFTAAGLPPQRMRDIMLDEFDFKELLDRTVAGRIPGVGAALAIAIGKGAYKGDRLRDWIRDVLERECGVERWGDLRITSEHDPESSLPPSHSYRLVVTITDVSRGRWSVPPGTSGRCTASIPIAS